LVSSRVGPLTIRFLVEGAESQGSVALFEFDAPAGAKVTAGHRHDGYDETITDPAYFRDAAAVLDAAADGPPDLAAPGEVMRSRRARASARPRLTRTLPAALCLLLVDCTAASLRRRASTPATPAS
jgi:hypothetical protein